jgi:hypothetical protein
MGTRKYVAGTFIKIYLPRSRTLLKQDAELYKKRLVSLLDLEPVIASPRNLSQDENLRLRTGLHGLSHQIASQYAMYPLADLKDASPEFLIALARKNLAKEILAKGEYAGKSQSFGLIPGQ